MASKWIKNKPKMKNFPGLCPEPHWGAYSAPKPPALINSLRVLRTLRSSCSLGSPLSAPQRYLAGYVLGESPGESHPTGQSNYLSVLPPDFLTNYSLSKSVAHDS